MTENILTIKFETPDPVLGFEIEDTIKMVIKEYYSVDFETDFDQTTKE
jgi:hypothetical protein